MKTIYEDLLFNNLMNTPIVNGEASELIHMIIAEAVAIGCNDPLFWQLAVELQAELEGGRRPRFSHTNRGR